MKTNLTKFILTSASTLFLLTHQASAMLTNETAKSPAASKTISAQFRTEDDTINAFYIAPPESAKVLEAFKEYGSKTSKEYKDRCRRQAVPLWIGEWFGSENCPNKGVTTIDEPTLVIGPTFWQRTPDGCSGKDVQQLMVVYKLHFSHEKDGSTTRTPSVTLRNNVEPGEWKLIDGRFVGKSK